MGSQTDKRADDAQPAETLPDNKGLYSPIACSTRSTKNRKPTTNLNVAFWYGVVKLVVRLRLDGKQFHNKSN